jgi:hypothetical protein
MPIWALAEGLKRVVTAIAIARLAPERMLFGMLILPIDVTESLQQSVGHDGKGIDAGQAF